MWKVYIVYPDGRKRLAGGVKVYRNKDTAEAAFGYYQRMVSGGSKTTFKGCTVELVQE